jgi:hypothetical protein
MRQGLFLDRASARISPRGTRPPRPGAFLSVLRNAWLLALVLGVAVPLLANHYATQMVQPGTLPYHIMRLDYTLQARGIGPLATAGALLGGLLLAAELGAQIGLRAYHRRAILARAGRADQRIVLRVRTPRIAPVPGARLERDPSADLFRAVQAALPSRWQRLGHAPYAAFMLLGEPDQPAALQVVIAGGTEAQRKRMAAEIRAAIRGQQPHAVIEAIDDPLAAALQNAPAVMWREFRLLLPPHYPLRLLDDVERTDILGPLLASLRVPAGVRCVEVQTIIQPIRGLAASFLHRGWRGHATALRLRLQQKQEYSLKDDAASIEAKLAGTPYYVTLRVVAVAERPAAPGHNSTSYPAQQSIYNPGEAGASSPLQTARNAIGAITSALGVYEARTSHLVQRWVSFKLYQHADRRILARAPRSIPLPALLLPPWLFRRPDILSSDEIAGLWHLPTPRIQELVSPLNSRCLAAPPAAFIQSTDTDRLTVGHVQRGDGTYTPVGPTLHDLREIMHVIAGQGAGKSRLAANIVQQLIPHGCTVFDGKGDDAGNLTTTVRKLIPRDAEHRLVLLDVLDTAWPIGLNPVLGTDTHQMLGQVQSVFARIDPEAWKTSPAMRTLLDMAGLLVIAGEAQPTLAHIKQALTDAGYRAQLLPKATNREVAQFWEQRADGIEEREQQSVDALLRRFHQLMTDELTRSIVVQQSPQFDFGRAMEQRLIVLAPIPHITLGGLGGVIGMLIFGAFVRAAVARPGEAQSRLNYPLIVDEVQVLLEQSDAKDFALALAQLRAFGIPAIYLHQAFAQLGAFKELMQVNAGSRIIMRTKPPDSAALASEFKAWGLSELDISSLDPLQQQYAVLRIAGTQCGPMSLRPLGWPEPVEDVPSTFPPDSWESVIDQLRASQNITSPSWQVMLPPAGADDDLDRDLRLVVYGDQAQVQKRAGEVASSLSENDWQVMQRRWREIADFQRRYIINNPASIPNRLERQRWLSRLLAATPRALVDIGYLRTVQQQPATRQQPLSPVMRSRISAQAQAD